MERESADIELRPAQPKDVPSIVEMIKGMAKYEKLEDQLEIDSERLLNCLFEENPIPKAIVATLDGTTVGYAIYFFNFSTFLGKKGVYLEDLYVDRAYRGTGIGNRLFMKVAEVARDENCGRMEWTALDWNEPALEFYDSRGAKILEDWKILRLTESGIEALVGQVD